MSATRFGAKLSPGSQDSYVLDFNDVYFTDPDKAPFLDDGEHVADLKLVLPAASAAMGLTIAEDAPYAPVEGNPDEFIVWFSIAEEQRQHRLFRQGCVLEIHAHVTTDAVPPRTPVAVFELVVKQ